MPAAHYCERIETKKKKKRGLSKHIECYINLKLFFCFFSKTTIYNIPKILKLRRRVCDQSVRLTNTEVIFFY